jgi:thiamine-phosphate pyrophosphorylase
VRRALAGGVSAVMLREKDLATDALVALGRDVAAACRDAGALFLVNHDVVAARELGADGVHLGFRSITVAAARAMAGEDALVGFSAHEPEETGRAVLEGADYVTFGPIYDTPSKQGFLVPRGAAALEAAVLAADGAPVVALGGIVAERVLELRRAGAAGVACIRAVLEAQDETAAARRLRDAWERAQ